VLNWKYWRREKENGMGKAMGFSGENMKIVIGREMKIQRILGVG
jgi:hypothetical protein